MDSRPDRSRELMVEGARALVDGVERLGAQWVVTVVTSIVDAWGQFDADERAATVQAARDAGVQAAARVTRELNRLFATDPELQRSTPLEIVRTLRFEATDVLRAAGVPPVERDPFDERAFPDDVYGVVLKSPTELGDEDLGGALLAWGLGKAQMVRERRAGGASG